MSKREWSEWKKWKMGLLASAIVVLLIVPIRDFTFPKPDRSQETPSESQQTVDFKTEKEEFAIDGLGMFVVEKFTSSGPGEFTCHFRLNVSNRETYFMVHPKDMVAYDQDSKAYTVNKIRIPGSSVRNHRGYSSWTSLSLESGDEIPGAFTFTSRDAGEVTQVSRMTFSGESGGGGFKISVKQKDVLAQQSI